MKPTHRIENFFLILPCMRIIVVCFALLLSALTTNAQRRVVVADRDTHEPVGQASLYTKEGGRFRSTISNDAGEAIVNFDFARLTVSHLNYERLQLRQLPDTIFLQPRYRQTREVVVRNVEPAWIRPMLKRFVRTKAYRYFARPTTLSYDYHTQSISSNNLYRYRSQGLLRPKNGIQEQHAIWQQEGQITSIDSTQLTDVVNLRRMLYQDFVQELTDDFISDHIFRENGAFASKNKDEIELVFRAKNRNDDRGRFVIDTVRCVVLSAWRKCGTKTNRHLRMNPFLYAMARAISGYRVEQWNTYYSVSYGMLADGQLYPDSVCYKDFFANYDNDDDKAEQEYHRQTGGGFPNMEATLKLSPCSSVPDSAQWLLLPRPWYLRLSSDAERQQEIELSHIPARFELMNEE